MEPEKLSVEQIEQMPAGYKLDKLVHFAMYPTHVDTYYGSSKDPVTEQQYNIKHYSEDIAAAWVVVDYLAQHWMLLQLGQVLDYENKVLVWEARFYTLEPEKPAGLSKSITAALAICHAALQAAT